MEHNLFKPQNFVDGQNAVVGDCNGFTMAQRYEVETPLFAKAIKSCITTRNSGGYGLVLDYGCGVGRLAKAVASREEKISVKGVDASQEMMNLASQNVGDPYIFQTMKPQDLAGLDYKFNVAYCIYVLQHVPSIEIREILQRIHFSLADDGLFIYCSSDYRMAIRFDGQGFFDDRFLGIDLQAEVERYFDKVGPLFSDQTLRENELLRKMVKGDATGLAHPAFIYKKKRLTGALFNATADTTYGGVMTPIAAPLTELVKTTRITDALQEAVNDNRKIIENKKEYTKLILINRLAPGDILVMTNALRDLHLAYPGKYQTEVRSPCNAIFDNNPYYTKLRYDENEYQREERELHKGDKNGHTFVIGGDILCIDMHYPSIHTSGETGNHFAYGHTDWLETVLGVKIPKTKIRPEIYLTQGEHDWINPVVLETGDDTPYWVINSGNKGDYTLKQYPHYQEVVDLLKDKVKFVQIGLRGHNHTPLNGVIDMVGKTDDTRKLFRLINGALGVLTCVSFPMHIAAALTKPCVVVAGGREGTRWELYPNQQFLYVNGCLPCAPYDGCWKSKFEDCTNKVGTVAKCMTMITPQDIVRSIERYYQGGVLQY